MNNVEKMYHPNGEIFFASYSKYIGELSSGMDFQSLSKIADLFLQARSKGRVIFFAGNGGSSTTASHFTQDIGEIGRKAQVEGFKTFGLTDNVSVLTAVGNDYGYEHVFCTAMKPHFMPDDVFVGISASGNSKNIIRAARLANAIGGTTVAMVGFSGGKLAQISDYVVHIQTPKGEYGPVEDLHLVVNHMLVSYLTLRLISEKPKNPPVMPLV